MFPIDSPLQQRPAIAEHNYLEYGLYSAQYTLPPLLIS